MFYLKKRIEIAGSHSLNLPYESKCRNLHGHNWIITVYCKSSLNNAHGMVEDFSNIKKVVVDLLDHKNLNEVVDFNPTAENLAQFICNQIETCYKVTVQESEGNEVTYIEDDI